MCRKHGRSNPICRRETIIADLDNRYTRLVVPRGTLRLRYEASVDLRLIMDDPLNVAETPIECLSLDVFPYLLPSRFCPSDLVCDIAQRGTFRIAQAAHAGHGDLQLDPRSH